MRFAVVFGILGVTSIAYAQEQNKEAEKGPEPPKVKVTGFVDTYFNVDPALPKTGDFGPVHRFRAFDVHDGFSLHWVGLDASVDPAPVGGTVGLRFGPSAAIYTGQPDTDAGLGNVKQAFVSYKPHEAVTLMLGKFDTPFGAEVADTQLNVTYTRSMLNFFGQPFFHTGLRGDFSLSSAWTLRAMVVNGWNATIDNNTGKTVGTQLSFKPNDDSCISLGWIGGPEQADSVKDETTGVVSRVSGANSRMRHLVDLVVDITAGKNRVLFNADYGTEVVPDPTGDTHKRWYGADLTYRRELGELLFLGLRGSIYRDPQGYTTGTNVDTRVTSGTVTFGIAPTKNFLIKLEPRADVANEPFFRRGVDEDSKFRFTTILGVVATTD